MMMATILSGIAINPFISDTMPRRDTHLNTAARDAAIRDMAADINPYAHVQYTGGWQKDTYHITGNLLRKPPREVLKLLNPEYFDTF